MSLRFDLHCHSTHSDGTLSPVEIAEAAMAAGLELVGIADHFASTALPEGRALPIDAIAAHVGELRSLRGRLRERLTVLAGLEINFSLVQTDLSFLGRYDPERSPVAGLDYVLFENVNEVEQCGLGLEELLKVRGLFPIPVGLAHNDLERNFSGILQPETLAQILAQSRIFVELTPSSRHARGDGAAPAKPWYRSGAEFTTRFFTAVARHGVDLALGSDAHESADEVGDVADAARFLSEHGLEGNAITLKYWRGAKGDGEGRP